MRLLIVLAIIGAFVTLTGAQKYDHERNFGGNGAGSGQFSLPHDVTFFTVFNSTENVTSNHIAVADTLNNRVQVLDVFGSFIREFGSSGDAVGSLAFPQGIAASYDDDTFTIYVSDTLNHRIQIANGSGNLTQEVGSLGVGAGQFISPKGICVSLESDLLFIADSGNHRVQVFNASSLSVLYSFGSYGTASDKMRNPTGIAYMDAEEQLIVVDRGNKRVQLWNANANTASVGTIITDFTDPTYVTASDRVSFFWVTDVGENEVKVYDKFGNFFAKYGDEGTGDESFKGPLGLTDDPFSNFTIIVDSVNGRVQVFDSEAELVEATTNLAAFLTTFAINVVLAIIFFIGFVITRCFKFTRKFYESNCQPFDEPEVWRDNRQPAPPPRGIFSLLYQTVFYNEDLLFETHGLDAWVFVKFLKYSFFMVCIYAVYGVCAILFVNIFAGKNKDLPEDNSLFVKGLEILSMANIERGSQFLWFHMVGVIFNTAATIFILKRFYDEFLLRRREHLSNPKLPENYTSMITDIPDYSGKGTIIGVDTGGNSSEFYDEVIMAYLNPSFNNKIIEVHRAQEAPKLEKRHNQRLALLNNLESSLAVYFKDGERPTHKTSFCGGEEVDSIDTYANDMKDKDSDLSDLFSSVDSYIKPTPTAFVTCKSISEATKLSQSTVNEQWLVEHAPEPRDIIWDNLTGTTISRFFRGLIVFIISFLIVFFYSVPIIFVQGFANLETLAMVPGLDFLDTDLDPAVRGLIQGYAPVIVLIVFMIILVPLLRFLSGLQLPAAQSEQDRSTSVKYFCFLVFNVLLISTIAGSVFKALDSIIDSPQSIVSLLASSLPQQASFFVNYIMTVGLAGSMMSLWRPVPLIIGLIFDRFLAKSKRAKRAVWMSGAFSYATNYAGILLVLMIVQIYSTLAPLILPFAIIYFGLAILSYKYNIIWADKTPFEGGGNYFTTIFVSVNIGLILYQLVSIGVFATYEFQYGIIIVVMLILSVCFFVYMMTSNKALHTYGALVEQPNKKDKTDLTNKYRAPFLQPPASHLNTEDQGTNDIPYSTDLSAFKLESSILLDVKSPASNGKGRSTTDDETDSVETDSKEHIIPMREITGSESSSDDTDSDVDDDSDDDDEESQDEESSEDEESSTEYYSS
mmetsp:Transcript_26412/g.29409  ORF Transcript_26412/g.29409 Transcript_26412/m.29409 type:complete len:1139 (-) Transcript_26412:815-4231(-)|eukprot:CAMPEP_0168509892 /NCGR_PEP_ID=MMETSP0405-20121227/1084_1 /TAXON_ID=498012 /ORGANISM="Trichosphaerium sp, Strain Am-I-7 wt" /LENGTH=1138 /DNA_ID=CAMNT_0008527513 /DNA_START=30 /DNA_END=3446 /DNA_ORIENTATION=-